MGGQLKRVDTNPNISPQLQSAVQNQIAQGQMTAPQISARAMEGVDHPQNVPTEDSLRQQTQGLGGEQDPQMLAAISNRQNVGYKSHLNDLSQFAGMNSRVQQMNQQRESLSAMADVDDLKIQVINSQLVKYQNDVAKHNTVLNSVLGLGGTVVGAAAGTMLAGPGGGAAGAMAGAQLGQGLAVGTGKMVEDQGGNQELHGLKEDQAVSHYFRGK